MEGTPGLIHGKAYYQNFTVCLINIMLFFSSRKRRDSVFQNLIMNSQGMLAMYLLYLIF